MRRMQQNGADREKDIMRGNKRKERIGKENGGGQTVRMDR
jgi:hypothetical protein